jgi:hypothetical protein
MLISPWEYSGSTLSPNSSHLPVPGVESKRRPKDDINDDLNSHVRGQDSSLTFLIA